MSKEKGFLIGVLIFFSLFSIGFATDFVITINTPANNSITNDNTSDFNFIINGTESTYIGELILDDIGYDNIGLEWNSNSTIISGLSDLGFNSAPEIFYKDGSWNLISGEGSSGFYGYTWTGSVWESNSSLVSGLSVIGYNLKPEIFEKGSIWYLIVGETDGIFNGFNWTGSSWQVDNDIINGLVDVGQASSPEVFFKDTIWYLISGESSTDFNGYNWNGTGWEINNSIISGLSAPTGYITPETFYKEDTWVLIGGEDNGIFYGYNWTGSTWQSDNNIISGLVDSGWDSTLNVFYKDTSWYVVAGNGNGNFYGYVRDNIINDTNTIMTPNTSVSDGVYSWYIESLYGSIRNQSEIRTITIDTIAPVINSNQTSNITPIYGDFINITANVTDATTSILWCNFTLTDPNSVDVIDNENGTQNGDIWNSSNYQINVSGNWTVNITCSDEATNLISSEWTFEANLGTLTVLPTTKTFSQVAGEEELFNLTLSHTGNNNNTIDFNIIGEINITENFTITFEEDPTIVEESETQYILVNITSNSSLDSGTYTGNITYNRTEDGENGIIEVSISISISAGNIYLTPETIDGASMNSDQIVTRILTINNTGTRILENCNFTIDTGLSSYTTFSNTSFDIDVNNESNVTMTVTTPSIGVYDTTITLTCIATAEGGLDTDTSSFLAIVTIPVVTGGSSGGPPITQICGDGICSGTETIINCPQDCIVKFTVIPFSIEESLRIDGKSTGRLKITNEDNFNKTIILTVKPNLYLKFDDDGKNVYALEILIPEKGALKTGEVYIDWILDIKDENLSLGDIEYTIYVSDAKNAIEIPAIFHIVEKIAYPVTTVIPILIGLVFIAIIGPSMVGKANLKRKMKKMRDIRNR